MGGEIRAINDLLDRWRNRVRAIESLCDEKERYERAWAEEQTRLGTFGQDAEGVNIEVTVSPTLLIRDIREAMR